MERFHGLGIRSMQGEKQIESCHTNNLIIENMHGFNNQQEKKMDMEEPRRWKQEADQ